MMHDRISAPSKFFATFTTLTRRARTRGSMFETEQKRLQIFCQTWRESERREEGQGLTSKSTRAAATPTSSPAAGLVATVALAVIACIAMAFPVVAEEAAAARHSERASTSTMRAMTRITANERRPAAVEAQLPHQHRQRNRKRWPICSALTTMSSRHLCRHPRRVLLRPQTPLTTLTSEHGERNGLVSLY